MKKLVSIIIFLVALYIPFVSANHLYDGNVTTEKVTITMEECIPYTAFIYDWTRQRDGIIKRKEVRWPVNHLINLTAFLIRLSDEHPEVNAIQLASIFFHACIQEPVGEFLIPQIL